MLLSGAPLLIQSVPQPAQAVLHAEKWQQGLGGGWGEYLNVLVLHLILP